MNKQITELKLSDIETVVGGVALAVSAVQMSASVYKAPAAQTWSGSTVPAKTLSVPLMP